MIRTAAAVAALVCAMPAAAQNVTVNSGEQVTFRITGTGVTPGARVKVQPSAFETAVAVEFDRGDHDDAAGTQGKPMGDDGTRPVAPVPETGLVRARLTATTGGGSILLIENGYPQGMAYRARMTKGDRSAPTGVCVVIPGKVGLEHWPHPIDTIEMSDIKLVPWTPADGMICE